MTIENLWAGWRAAYVGDLEAHTYTDAEGTLFERILHAPVADGETYIVHRGEHCFVMLNRFPYGTGHLLVMPNRGVAQLEDLTAEESAELWALMNHAVTVLKAVYGPDGINVGFNLGKAAGAGVPDHLHGHVLPRWNGDTNFTTALAEIKVLPESLDSSWSRIRDAWGDASASPTS